MTNYEYLSNDEIIEAIRQGQETLSNLQKRLAELKTGECLPIDPAARLAMIVSSCKLLRKQLDELEALSEAGLKPQKLQNS